MVDLCDLMRPATPILNAELDDIEMIFQLYRAAADYQRSKACVVVWPEFEKELVLNEIREGRKWKLLVENQIGCVWAVAFKDDQIWPDSANDKAIYIHRIAANPNFRGQNFVRQIVDWAREYATSQKIDFIRLDTIGNNQRLIDHYCDAGFEYLGMFELQDTTGLPDHYSHDAAALFEIDLRK